MTRYGIGREGIGEYVLFQLSCWHPYDILFLTTLFCPYLRISETCARPLRFNLSSCSWASSSLTINKTLHATGSSRACQ